MKKLLAVMGLPAALAVGITSCSGNEKKIEAEVAKQVQQYKDSIRLAADTAGLAEFQQWKAQNELMNEEETGEMQEAAPVAKAPARSTSRSYSSASRRSSSSDGGSYSSTSSNTAKANRGWSKAAKGAVIGGAGGAAAGAIINKKNRAAGAVVGGIVGAGGGYVIGRQMDKKDGRY